MLSSLFGRREKEQEVKGMNRLPPGQSLTQKFPVLHYGPTVHYRDLSQWDLRVFGEVEQELTWNWEQFNQLPRTQIVMDIHCVTRWSKFDTVWEGVQFKHIAELAGMKPTTQHIIAHCDLGYTTNVPVEDMMRDDVLLTYKFDGQFLEPDHGAPVRTLVPHLYFWKSAKFLRGLEFSTVDKPGFWEQAGYHNYGDPFKEQRHGRRGW